MKYLKGREPEFQLTNLYNLLGKKLVRIPIYDDEKDTLQTDSLYLPNAKKVSLDLYFGPPDIVLTDAINFQNVKWQTMSNLTYVMPCFIVTDLKISVSFYVGKLGFEVLYTGPDESPFWAIVGRDNISIMLKAVAPDIKPIPNRTRHEWAPSDVYISAAEPDALFNEYHSKGVAFNKPINDNSDKIRGFEIEDADGYSLFFGRPNV